jgi:hypothetical protein
MLRMVDICFGRGEIHRGDAEGIGTEIIEVRYLLFGFLGHQ